MVKMIRNSKYCCLQELGKLRLIEALKAEGGPLKKFSLKAYAQNL